MPYRKQQTRARKVRRIAAAFRRAASIGALMALASGAWAAEAISLDSLAANPPTAILGDGKEAAGLLDVERAWTGNHCALSIRNKSGAPQTIREVRVFSVPLAVPPESRVYGEGFTMLSQTGGTLGDPKDLGALTDRDHYKLPEAEGKRTVHGIFTLSTPAGAERLFGFTSCNRFDGQFRFNASGLEVVVDMEGLSIQPNEKIELEEFVFLAGKDRNALLREFAGQIALRHPRLKTSAIPTGWCSWYCYGPAISEQKILTNLDVIERERLPMRFVQIDDGYQAAMGDWLETGKGFGQGLAGVLKRIKEKGFEPAIWVAPFIAEEKSRLFQEHPGWFIRDGEGKPLASDRVSFGGWRRGPWFCLDGTNPEVQKHLEELFRTMRERWDCKYFKLDALFWGAMHGGKFHDGQATRIEAYRRGMEAILRGAAEGSFILGCNHPMWPSLGLIHGSRSSMDVTRKWDAFKSIAAETFWRNWQNNRLWVNDPDCLLLTGKLSEAEYGYHAAAVLASGGMILSGDNLTQMSQTQLATLRRLLAEHPEAAEFEDHELSVARMKMNGQDLIAVFNAGDAPRSFSVRLPDGASLADFWTGEPFNPERDARNDATIPDVAPHSARVYKVIK